MKGPFPVNRYLGFPSAVSLNNEDNLMKRSEEEAHPHGERQRTKTKQTNMVAVMIVFIQFVAITGEMNNTTSVTMFIHSINSPPSTSKSEPHVGAAFLITVRT